MLLSRPTSRLSGALVPALLALSIPAAHAQEVHLPPPSADPLQAGDADDPILAFGHDTFDDGFAALIAAAVAQAPEIGEARGREREAAANRDEARAQLFPQGQLSLSRTSPLASDFVGGVDTLYEATRARPRTDATLDADQLLFDFGATSSRIRATSSRRTAAAQGTENDTSDIALRAIHAYYDVAYSRALVALGQSIAATQTDVRHGVEEQVRGGVAADGDLPQVDAMIANARSRTVRYERRLAAAEAEFAAVFGHPAPAHLAAAPQPLALPSLDAALLQARHSPAVRQAESVAAAAHEEERAARRDRLPRVSAALGAGRYYLFDSGDNYDVRVEARIVQRFGGGLGARADAAGGRAVEAAFRADQVRRDTLRDADIAWHDIANLQTQLDASRAAYLANRRARDVLIQRFRYTRGTLFNLLSLSDSFAGSAESYLLADSELKLARYTLLARTGQLLPALHIAPPSSQRPL